MNIITGKKHPELWGYPGDSFSPPVPDCTCPRCAEYRAANPALTPRVADGAADPKEAKPSMGLIPVGAMEAVARAMELGATKYGPYNWRTKKIKLMVYAHAALRHLFKWIGGESVDAESGQSQLAHVAACALIMLDASATGNAIDDRTWPKD